MKQMRSFPGVPTSTALRLSGTAMASWQRIKRFGVTLSGNLSGFLYQRDGRENLAEEQGADVHVFDSRVHLPEILVYSKPGR